MIFLGLGEVGLDKIVREIATIGCAANSASLANRNPISTHSAMARLIVQPPNPRAFTKMPGERWGNYSGSQKE
jgi:hypothetical protein